jgi:hypothetical protein
MASTSEAPGGWHCWWCHPEGPTTTQVALTTGSGEPASRFDQIRQLAALRDEGILSGEEFETKKAELLGRL